MVVTTDSVYWCFAELTVAYHATDCRRWLLMFHEAQLRVENGMLHSKQ